MKSITHYRAAQKPVFVLDNGCLVLATEVHLNLNHEFQYETEVYAYLCLSKWTQVDNTQTYAVA